MKQPTFIEGAAVALIAEISGSVLFSALHLVMPAETTLQLLIPLLSFSYGLYLMSRCRERLGRITAIGVWLVVTLKRRDTVSD